MAGHTEKTLSPSLGNGLAYFAIWYLGHKYGAEFEDETMAALMMGAIVSSLLLYVRSFFTAIGKGFILIFGSKK